MADDQFLRRAAPSFYNATVSQDTRDYENQLGQAIASRPTGLRLPTRGNVAYNPNTQEFAVNGNILGKLGIGDLENILKQSMAAGPQGAPVPEGFQSVDESRFAAVLGEARKDPTADLGSYWSSLQQSVGSLASTVGAIAGENDIRNPWGDAVENKRREAPWAQQASYDETSNWFSSAGLGTSIAQGLGQVTPAIAAGAVNPALGVATLMGTSAGAQADSAYEQLYAAANDMTPAELAQSSPAYRELIQNNPNMTHDQAVSELAKTARYWGLGVGAVEGGLSALLGGKLLAGVVKRFGGEAFINRVTASGVNKVFKPFEGVGGAKGIAGTALMAGLGEGSGAIAGDFAVNERASQQLGKDASYGLGDAWDSFAQEAPLGFLFGALGGGHRGPTPPNPTRGTDLELPPPPPRLGLPPPPMGLATRRGAEYGFTMGDGTRPPPRDPDIIDGEFTDVTPPRALPPPQRALPAPAPTAPAPLQLAPPEPDVNNGQPTINVPAGGFQYSLNQDAPFAGQGELDLPPNTVPNVTGNYSSNLMEENYPRQNSRQGDMFAQYDRPAPDPLNQPSALVAKFFNEVVIPVIRPREKPAGQGQSAPVQEILPAEEMAPAQVIASIRKSQAAGLLSPKEATDFIRTLSSLSKKSEFGPAPRQSRQAAPPVQPAPVEPEVTPTPEAVVTPAPEPVVEPTPNKGERVKQTAKNRQAGTKFTKKEAQQGSDIANANPAGSTPEGENSVAAQTQATVDGDKKATLIVKADQKDGIPPKAARVIKTAKSKGKNVQTVETPQGTVVTTNTKTAKTVADKVRKGKMDDKAMAEALAYDIEKAESDGTAIIVMDKAGNVIQEELTTVEKLEDRLKEMRKQYSGEKYTIKYATGKYGVELAHKERRRRVDAEEKEAAKKANKSNKPPKVADLIAKVQAAVDAKKEKEAPAEEAPAEEAPKLGMADIIIYLKGVFRSNKVDKATIEKLNDVTSVDEAIALYEDATGKKLPASMVARLRGQMKSAEDENSAKKQRSTTPPPQTTSETPATNTTSRKEGTSRSRAKASMGRINLKQQAENRNRIEEIREVIAKFTKRLRADAPSVVILKFSNDLPKEIKEDHPRYRLGEGFYDRKTNTVYILAENVTPERATRVLIHEIIGHFGIDSVVTEEGWLEIEDDVAALRESGKYGEFFKNLDEEYPPTEFTDRERAMEAVARISELQPDARVVQKVIEFIKKAFKAIGLTASSKEIQDDLPASIRRALDESRRFVRSDEVIMNSLGQPVAWGKKSQGNFEKWFGNSAVTDGNGDPLVVYHATNNDFDRFNTKSSELGSHFGTGAQSNTVARHKVFGRTLPMYLSIQNPLRLIDHGEFNADTLMPQFIKAGVFTEEQGAKILEMDDADEQDALAQKAIQDAGYDGVVYLNRREGLNRSKDDTRDLSDLNVLSDAEWLEEFPESEDSWIAFESEQIKSAVSNSGAYGRYTPQFSASFIPNKRRRSSASMRRAATDETASVFKKIGDELSKRARAAKNSTIGTTLFEVLTNIMTLRDMQDIWAGDRKTLWGDAFHNLVKLLFTKNAFINHQLSKLAEQSRHYMALNGEQKKAVRELMLASQERSLNPMLALADHAWIKRSLRRHPDVVAAHQEMVDMWNALGEDGQQAFRGLADENRRVAVEYINARINNYNTIRELTPEQGGVEEDLVDARLQELNEELEQVTAGNINFSTQRIGDWIVVVPHDAGEGALYGEFDTEEEADAEVQNIKARTPYTKAEVYKVGEQWEVRINEPTLRTFDSKAEAEAGIAALREEIYADMLKNFNGDTAKADAAMRKLWETQSPDDQSVIIPRVVAKKRSLTYNEREYGSFSPAQVKRLNDLFRTEKITKAAYNILMEDYLRSADATSVTLSRLRRKLVRGATESDMMTAYVTRYTSMVHALANAKVHIEELGLRDQLESSNLQDSYIAMTGKDPVIGLNALTKHEEATATMLKRSVSNQFLQTVRGLTTFLNLALSPAYAMMNMTQPMVIGIPYLASKEINGHKVTVAEATAAVQSAMFSASGQKRLLDEIAAGVAADAKVIFNKKVTREQFTNDAVEDIVTKWTAGMTPEQKAGFLQLVLGRVSETDGSRYDGLMENDALALSYTDSIYDAMNVTKTGDAIKRLERMSMALGKLTEVANRLTMARAAFILGSKHGLEGSALKDFVEQAIYRSQGDFSRTNRAAAFNNPWIGTALQFKTYVQLIYGLFIRSASMAFRGKTVAERREGFRMFSGMVTAHALIGGFTGLGPITWMLKVLAVGILGFGGSDDEEMDEFLSMDAQWRRGIREMLDDPAGEGMLYAALTSGLPAAFLGVDASERMAIPSLVDTRFVRVDPNNPNASFVNGVIAQAVGGAPYSTVLRLYDGMMMMANGASDGDTRDFYLGLSKVMPQIVANSIKAADKNLRGVIDQSGREVVEVDKITGSDILTNIMGFRTYEETSTQRKRGDFFKTKSEVNERRNELLKDYRRARGGDRERIRQTIKEFNKTVPPELQITGDVLTRSMRQADSAPDNKDDQALKKWIRQ